MEILINNSIIIEILNSKGKYGGQHSKPAGCSDTCVEANYGGSAKAHIDEHAAVITYTDGFLFTYLGRSVTRLRFASGDNEKGEKGGRMRKQRENWTKKHLIFQLNSV